jgi:hypothetical protein
MLAKGSRSVKRMCVRGRMAYQTVGLTPFLPLPGLPRRLIAPWLRAKADSSRRSAAMGGCQPLVHFSFQPPRHTFVTIAWKTRANL